MGNCFSDPSKSSKGGQKLGSGPATTTATTTGNTNTPGAGPRNTGTVKSNGPPRTLGGGSGGVSAEEGDARDRALRAAEERAKVATTKGVHSANPKAGKLSAQLAAERKSPVPAGQPGDERLMDRGQWN